MASAKPTQPPAFDASTHEKVLYDEIRKADGSGYQVFLDKALAKWKRWVSGENEYDGTGLRDVVLSNATYLDQVKAGVDALDDREATHHAAQAQRLTALEDAVANPPFPG